MNTGISNPFRHPVHVAGLLAGFIALGACTDGAGGEGGFSFAMAGTGKAVQTGPAIPKSPRAELAGGTVKIKAPKGYCVDQTSIKNGLTGSSAMIAACTSLDGKGANETAAVITVSVSPRREADARAPNTDDLAAAVAPAPVLARIQKGTLALVQVGQGGEGFLAPADPVHWRGATMLDTRLVMLALFAPKGTTLVGPKGADLMTALARGISTKRGSLFGQGITARDEQTDVSTTQELKPDTSNAAQEGPPAKKAPSGFIGRLFNRS